jgi:hypothetical protein
VLAAAAAVCGRSGQQNFEQQHVAAEVAAVQATADTQSSHHAQASRQLSHPFSHSPVTNPALYPNQLLPMSNANCGLATLSTHNYSGTQNSETH